MVQTAVSQQPGPGDLLTVLEQSGPTRPRSMTLADYLHHLADFGLAQSAEVDAFLAFYHRFRFSGSVTDDAWPEHRHFLEEVTGRLQGLSDEERADLEQRLQPVVAEVFYPPENPEAAFEALPEVDEDLDVTDEEGGDGTRPDPPAEIPITGNRFQRAIGHLLRQLRNVTLFAWALIALMAVSMFLLGLNLKGIRGYALESIPRLGGLPSYPKSLRALSREAAANPGNPFLWQELAQRHHTRRNYPEAIACYRHVITLRPYDPNLLNSLAWLFCRARDPVYRDYRQALDLARRAYTINRGPHIADTLAEAEYYNGNYERAVELAKDTVNRATFNVEHFQEQLQRFEKALIESQNEAQEAQ